MDNNNELLIRIDERLENLTVKVENIEKKVSNGLFKKSKDCYNDKKIVYKNVDEIKEEIKCNRKDIRRLMIKTAILSFAGGGAIPAGILLIKNFI